MVSVTATSLRYPLAASYFLAWASSVIVMGIVSYFISKYPRGQHVIFEEVISTIFTAFYLPSFAAPLIKSYRSWYLPLNIIFSYLWLTAFIFASQDYNRGGACQAYGPPGATNCHLKWANQSFLFLAFFFTLLSMIMEILAYKSYDRSPIYTERKVDTRPSGETGVTA